MAELINCHLCGKQHDKWITCGSILIDTQELLDLRKRVKELERREKKLIKSNFLYTENLKYLELHIRELEACCEGDFSKCKALKQRDILEKALSALLDGYDANRDECCELTEKEWDARIENARQALGACNENRN